MELSEEQLASIVQEATKSLQHSLQERIVLTLGPMVTQKATNMVVRHTEEWVAKNVLPEVTLLLESGKHSLQSSAIQAASAMSESITDGIKKTIDECMESNYKRKKFFEAIFGL